MGIYKSQETEGGVVFGNRVVKSYLYFHYNWKRCIIEYQKIFFSEFVHKIYFNVEELKKKRFYFL